MRKIKISPVSMAVVLRDYMQIPFVNEEHELLVNVADFMYSFGMRPKCLDPEARSLYNKYGSSFFSEVIQDIRAIKSQLSDYSMHDLVLDYQDYLTGAMGLYTKELA